MAASITPLSREKVSIVFFDDLGHLRKSAVCPSTKPSSANLFGGVEHRTRPSRRAPSLPAQRQRRAADVIGRTEFKTAILARSAADRQMLGAASGGAGQKPMAWRMSGGPICAIMRRSLNPHKVHGSLTAMPPKTSILEPVNAEIFTRFK